jgi:hypothetical protein
MLDTTIFDKMNGRSSEVVTDYLAMGVYKMKLVNVEQTKSKAGEDMIKVSLDTGFKNKEGVTRMMFNYYNINSTFKDRDGITKPSIDLFVSFMKQCFGLEKFDQIAINKCIGQSLAVATKRDKDGYFAFWYAGNLSNIVNMQKSYTQKDKSNGNRPTPTNTPAPTPVVNDNTVYDSEGNPIF